MQLGGRRSQLLATFLLASAVLWAQSWAQDVSSTTCNPASQRASLLQFYSQTNGPAWANTNNIWGTDSVCQKVSPVNNTQLQLPSHCCWYGVSCCWDPQPCPPAFNTSFLRVLCGCGQQGLVTAISMNNNNLVGEWPAGSLDSLACSLKALDLSFNHLSGNIEPNLGNFTQLSAVSLAYNNFSGPLPSLDGNLSKLLVLEVTNNSFSGTIPPDICNGTKLTDLLLGNNQLSGELQLEPCPDLVLLDVSNNFLSGPLPKFEGFNLLHILRMGNNSFTGGVPDTLALASWITDLDLSNNLLNGTIPDNFASLRLLNRALLLNNSLTGTLPPGLFSDMGTLNIISLSSNNITGTITISERGSPVPTLMLVDFSNSYLLGRVPDFMEAYANDNTSVNLELTFMSCCGLDPLPYEELQYKNFTFEAYQEVNWTAVMDPDSWLPPFLAFSDTLMPVMPRIPEVQDYANMRCPALRNKNAGNDDLLRWSLDPDYYLYSNCVCELGYELVNLTRPGKLAWFKCAPKHTVWWRKYPWAIPVIILGSMLLLLLLLFASCYRKGARPAIMQQYINMVKRVQGEPREGLITVVTTDIEGYSDLMKREPDLMGKGLRIHNFCIDAARWQFYGYTMEQEGDSFTIAFHEPFDAVAFCLMAQQLLNMVAWPNRLRNPEGLAEPRNRSGSIFSNAFLSAARLILEKDRSATLGMRRSGNGPGNGNGNGGTGNGVSTATTPTPGMPPASPTALEASSGQEVVSPSADAPQPHVAVSSTDTGSTVPGRQSDPGSGAHSSVASSTAASSTDGLHKRLKLSRLWRDGSRRAEPPILEDQATTQPVDVLPGYGSLSLDHETGSQPGSPRDPLQGGGIRLCASQQQGRACALFSGLRVRMGCATGRVERGQALRASPIMERAKVVSDAGAGGQVLMDDATFQEVCGRLLELGAVDHNGLSVSKTNLSRPTLMEEWCGRCRHPRDLQDDMAVVLDMGTYMRRSKAPARPPPWGPMAHPAPLGLSRHHPNSALRRHSEDAAVVGTPHSPAAAREGSGLQLTTASSDAATAVEATVVAAAAAATVEGVASSKLHLHQILSPSLIGRAQHFGTQLALGSEWVCVEPPKLTEAEAGAPQSAPSGLGQFMVGRTDASGSKLPAPA